MPAKQRRSNPRLSVKRDHNAMEPRCLEALSLLADGISQSEVASRLDVSRHAVSTWVTANAIAESQALANSGKPDRKTAPTPAGIQKVEAALLKGTVTNGYRNDLWTLRRAAEIVARVTGRPRPSISQTWGPLSAMRWSCQRPARRACQQNTEVVAEFRERTWTATKNAIDRRKPITFADASGLNELATRSASCATRKHSPTSIS